MFHHQLKTVFNTAIEKLSSHISFFVKKPDRDLSRIRKFPPLFLYHTLCPKAYLALAVKFWISFV